MKKSNETVLFEVGKAYRNYDSNVIASVTSRTPKFVSFTLENMDNDTAAPYFGKDYKCKVFTNDYNVEKICLKDFWDKDDDLSFAADTEYVVIVDDSDDDISLDDCFFDDDGTNDDVDDELSVDYTPALENDDDDELVDEPVIISPILNHSHNGKPYELTFIDRQSAIEHIENFLPQFVIDSKYRVFDGVFATNFMGDELELHDDFIRLKVTRNNVTTLTFFYLDIPESRFIAKLKEVTAQAVNDIDNLSSFQITGNSGSVYTFDARTFDVIAIDEPVVDSVIKDDTPPVDVTPIVDEPEDIKLIDYVLNERFKAQHTTILKATRGLSA